MKPFIFILLIPFQMHSWRIFQKNTNEKELWLELFGMSLSHIRFFSSLNLFYESLSFFLTLTLSVFTPIHTPSLPLSLCLCLYLSLTHSLTLSLSHSLSFHSLTHSLPASVAVSLSMSLFLSFSLLNTITQTDLKPTHFYCCNVQGLDINNGYTGNIFDIENRIILSRNLLINVEPTLLIVYFLLRYFKQNCISNNVKRTARIVFHKI